MLTVYEALLFAARLRLPETVSDSVKSQRVEEVMEKLGIESIRNVRIGWNSDGKARGISGGEMRRVSIGLELIAKPDVLLLDEPTSGARWFRHYYVCWSPTMECVHRTGFRLCSKGSERPSRRRS
jgi:energy-coupling factor transporter ATP-binding protein EcfA2